MGLLPVALLAFLLGFVTRRPSWMVAAPGIAALYYLGLHEGMWGEEPGGNWRFATSNAAAAALIGAALGYLCGLLVARPRDVEPEPYR